MKAPDTTKRFRELHAQGCFVMPNPWDAGTLEWWAPSPPPIGNFDRPLPAITSERPVWDAEHPEHPAEAEHPEREIVPAEASP